jgi:hypothetical protein
VVASRSSATASARTLSPSNQAAVFQSRAARYAALPFSIQGPALPFQPMTSGIIRA